MRKFRFTIALLVLFPLISFGAPDSLTSMLDSSRAMSDTIVTAIKADSSSGSALLDSLRKESEMRKLFFINERISGNVEVLQEVDKERNLPGIKMIRYRGPQQESWKFWVLALTLFLMALLRLSNAKRFDELLVSAGDLQPDLNAYTEKLGNYLFIQLFLFLNFLIGISLFWVTYSQHHQTAETANYGFLLWQQVLVLVVAYLVKAASGFVVGGLCKLNTLNAVLLFNTLVVNNFLGVVLVFLNMLYIFVPGDKSRIAIEAIILISIFVAVIYRQIKNLLMSLQQSKEQLIYIILYFCAMEIVPWLIILKIFINGW